MELPRSFGRMAPWDCRDSGLPVAADAMGPVSLNALPEALEKSDVSTPLMAEELPLLLRLPIL